MRLFIRFAPVAVLFIAGCLPDPNILAHVPATEGAPLAGFWEGLWHGILAPITFWLTLVFDEVGIYELRNRGVEYDFGFWLGWLVDAFLFVSAHNALSNLSHRPPRHS